MYLARDLGMLDATKVRLIELLSATDCLSALAAGTIDGAGLTLDETLFALSEGVDLHVVLVFNFSFGADMLVGRVGMQSLADLADKRVGLESTAVGALMLAAALERAGLTSADIDRVALPHDRHHQAFVSGEVDAIVTFDPVATQLLDSGAIRLFDSRDIPDRIVDVLAVTPSALNDNPLAMRHLIGAYFDALDHIQRQPLDAAYRMAPRMGIPVSQVAYAQGRLRVPDLRENRRLLGGTPPMRASTTERLISLMQAEQLIGEAPAIGQLFDPRFLPEDGQR